MPCSCGRSWWPPGHHATRPLVASECSRRIQPPRAPRRPSFEEACTHEAVRSDPLVGRRDRDRGGDVLDGGSFHGVTSACERAPVHPGAVGERGGGVTIRRLVLVASV